MDMKYKDASFSERSSPQGTNLDYWVFLPCRGNTVVLVYGAGRKLSAMRRIIIMRHTVQDRSEIKRIEMNKFSVNFILE